MSSISAKTADSAPAPATTPEGGWRDTLTDFVVELVTEVAETLTDAAYEE